MKTEDMRDEVYLKKLGKKVSKLRKEHKITQELFAEKLKSHRSTIIRIEKGEINSSINMLRNIASKLNIPIEELVKVE